MEKDETGAMTGKRIAVPSLSPGGLNGRISDRFCHCELYTIVNTANGAIGQVEIITNQEPSAGDCMLPVTLLKAQGVDTVIATGMAERTLQGFLEVGVTVYMVPHRVLSDIKSAVAAFLEGKLPLLDEKLARRSSGNR